jgi:hypothetical protein
MRIPRPVWRICTSGGNVMYAAARDSKVAAVATVAAHFAEPSVIASVPVYGGPQTIERHRVEGRAARARYEQTGQSDSVVCYHDTDQSAAFIAAFDYDLDPTRGGRPQWRNELAVMSWEPWLEFNPVREAAKVTAPTLIVHSDGSVMPDQAHKVHGLLAGQKTVHWANGDHFDFDDRPETVRATGGVIADHFHRHLG